MNYRDILKDISIEPGALVKFKNNTKFKLIGKGSQGAVLKLDDGKCLKVYSKPQNAANEVQAYKLTVSSNFFPKLYDSGLNYIVIDYINGYNLKEFIGMNGYVTESTVHKILLVLNEIKRLGFRRVDINLRHIFLSSTGEIKVIDLIHLMRVRKPGPKCLFKDFVDLGLLNEFLSIVKKLDFATYCQWEKEMPKYFNL